MKTTKTNRMSTQTLALASMMTALVIVCQILATYTTFFGPFSTAIALVPIAIGAVMCGPMIGTWLGLVFGIVVLSTGGANLFLGFNVIGTFITVLFKGAACGFAAGTVNKLLRNFNKDVAAVASAIICPIVNTGVFLLCGYLFFMPYAEAIAEMVNVKASGFEVFLALATANFVFELLLNIIFSPVILKVLSLRKKHN